MNVNRILGNLIFSHELPHYASNAMECKHDLQNIIELRTLQLNNWKLIQKVYQSRKVSNSGKFFSSTDIDYKINMLFKDILMYARKQSNESKKLQYCLERFTNAGNNLNLLLSNVPTYQNSIEELQDNFMRIAEKEDVFLLSELSGIT